MKKIVFAAMILVATTAFAQDEEIAPAKKGAIYGTVSTTNKAAVSPDEIEQKATGGTYTGRITGKVAEVCQAMGCWFTVQKSDGTEVMVKAKDHSYFLPQNLAGKTVIIDGTAKVKEITEAERRHFAEDGGKPKEEIEKIKGSEKQVQIIAAGVKVLD